MKYETLREYFGDMPPLDHYPLRDYREFRWEDSEVVEYMLAHQKFMANLFSSLRESKAIVFDPDTKTWRGYRYREPAKSARRQNSSSKPDSFSPPPLSKPQFPHGVGGTGGVSDSRQSPNPTVTAAGGFDSGKKSKTEVRDEPW